MKLVALKDFELAGAKLYSSGDEFEVAYENEHQYVAYVDGHALGFDKSDCGQEFDVLQKSVEGVIN